MFIYYENIRTKCMVIADWCESFFQKVKLEQWKGTCFLNTKAMTGSGMTSSTLGTIVFVSAKVRSSLKGVDFCVAKLLHQVCWCNCH